LGVNSMKNNAILTFSYQNEDADLSVPDGMRKIIRMSPKGFFIAVISGEKKAKRLFQYSFNDNDLSFNDKLRMILSADKELNIDCATNLFRLYTQFNVQIPNEFYEQENNKTVLSLIVENPQNYVPVAEKIDNWNFYNLSAWKKDLHSGIKKKFPNYELNTVLSSLLPIIERQKEEEKVLIFVGDNNFTILAANKQKLLGINTFSFSDENDFLYYAYAFLRKMYINPSSVSMKLSGNIATQSSLYTILNKYFSDINVIVREKKVEEQQERQGYYFEDDDGTVYFIPLDKEDILVSPGRIRFTIGEDDYFSTERQQNKLKEKYIERQRAEKGDGQGEKLSENYSYFCDLFE
jgi:hypothetical protein